jgi:hypothetical protein
MNTDNDNKGELQTRELVIDNPSSNLTASHSLVMKKMTNPYISLIRARTFPYQRF